MTGDSASETCRRRIRSLREERGFSQAELGTRLGEYGQPLGQSRVAAIEASGSVTVDQVTAFAGALDVPVEMLLHERPAGGGVLLHQLRRILEEADQLRNEIRAMIAATGPPDRKWR